MAKIICFGEMLLRLSPAPQSYLFQTPQLQSHFVGAEANVGVTLRQLEHDVAFISTFPQGKLGRACQAVLRTQGVKTDHCLWSEGRLALFYLETGAMMRPSEIIYDRDASVFALQDPQGYDWAAILGGADWLHICGITLAVSDASYQAAYDAMTTARELGVKISFDCNYRAALWAGREAESRRKIRKVFSMAALIFGNIRDAALIFDVDGPSGRADEDFKRASSAFFEHCGALKWLVGTQRHVLTADHNQLQGFISNGQMMAATDIYELQGIIDRIGTGDAFAGGIIHALASGYDLEKVINWGVATSALKHSILGDFHCITPQDIERLLGGGDMDVKR